MQKIMRENCNLSLMQQSNLMKDIDDLAKIEDEVRAKGKAEELIDFIFALEAHSFISSDKRSRYHLGIEDAMERRRRFAGNKG